MILRSKIRVDSPYNGLDMALFIRGLNAMTIRKTAILVYTHYASGAMFPYTTPLHVIRSIIGERGRANLVVQLARFFYLRAGATHTVMFYVFLNQRTPSRTARARCLYVHQIPKCFYVNLFKRHGHKICPRP